MNFNQNYQFIGIWSIIQFIQSKGFCLISEYKFWELFENRSANAIVPNLSLVV
jgi:hypothetical protein